MIALFKTMTYGIMHVCVATALAFLMTGSWAIALSLGLLEPAVQTVFFYMHERVWNFKTQSMDGKAGGVSIRV
ncbi:MAG: DUF2061 domain-containing protein [Rickettsiales bacterium]